MTEITEQPLSNVVRMPASPTVKTASGRHVDLLRPDPKQIDIEDIAWALSRLPVSNGHTAGLLPVSAALQAVWVAMYCWHHTRDPITAMHALLYNAHLAYSGALPDAATKISGLAHEWNELTGRLQRCIELAISLPKADGADVSLIHQAKHQVWLMEQIYHHVHKPDAAIPSPDALAKHVGRIDAKNPIIGFERYMTAYRLFQRMA